MNPIKRLVKSFIPRKVQKRVLLAMYSGDQQECPCCGGRFRSFWPSGETAASMRPNTLCPACSSLERHRLLWLYIKANNQLLAGKRKVLHVAPEPIFTRLLQSFPDVEYLSADLESPLAMVKMDVADIQFPDNSFDVILCYHVLEHVPDDVQAMRELYRVLKPGGWAILQSPLELERAATYEDSSITAPHEREQAFGQRDHVRLYGRDYKDRLEKAGWTVKVDAFARELGAEKIARFSVNPEEDIYFCTKSSAAS
ncbi:MAG TPA: methyltransferase domain-containing protein [Abditibacteriaceae bacterium]|nr:methyltransferase domain-containing protein [Abditibacteriaceae bacterium]